MSTGGVDYRVVTRSKFLKRSVRRILLNPVLNRLMLVAVGFLPDGSWKERLPFVGTSKLLIEGERFVLLKHGERCGIAREVYWSGGVLRSPADRLALGLAIKLASDAEMFLDIGSYTGLFALAVARANSDIRCHAYEIVPENHQLLWSNVIENNLITRVSPWLLGLGAQRGVLGVPMSLGGGVLASSVALDSIATDGVDIPVDTLDSLFDHFNGRMVIKIDVEGYEWDVLQGGMQLLIRVRPDMVCEVLRRAPNIPEMEKFLKSAGYRMYHISDAGLRLADHIVPVKLERDWLFTVRSVDELKAFGLPFAV